MMPPVVFEDPACLDGASVQGDVTITSENPYRGEKCLLFRREQKDMETLDTRVELPAFPVKEGMWDFAVALRGEMYSPDSSYNGTVRLETMDAAGEFLAKHEIALVTNKKVWVATRKRMDIGPEVATARFTITMEKTHGYFAVDGLEATYVGPNLKTVTAITFATEAVGNLFLPEQPLAFTVGAVCRKARPAELRTAQVTVRDYWGAEYGTRNVELTDEGRDDRDRLVYSGRMDLTGLPIELGRYYELHAEMPEPELPEPARDTSSFAVLPEAVTKQHPPFDVPFTNSCWNPGVPGVFPLADRLGLRVTNVYSRWSCEPPYEHTAPGIEEVIELGMGALLSTPVNIVERRRPGFEKYDETCMREGARGLIEAYRDRLPIALRVGNEPHPRDDDDVLNMIKTYKAVWEGAKAAKPDITVTATSCGPEEAFFRLGYQDYHDVYIFHQYADAQVIKNDFKRYNDLVETYGKRKPVWSTELGLNSQGMSRQAVGIQMLKLLTNFFALGGANASWFGLMWPDPDGKIVGSNGDSFDVFNSKYCLYSPKITAITEYNFVNALCIKKLVEQRTYPDGECLTLFRDVNDRCLVMAWNDKQHRPVSLPIANVGEVSAVRLDGSQSRFTPGDAGLTLALQIEPYLIEFDSADFQLPETLGAPAASLAAAVQPVVKGGSVQIPLATPGCTADAVRLDAPPRWAVGRSRDADGHLVFEVDAPADTAAREGRLVLQLGPTVGEIYLPVQVQDALAVRFVPAPYTDAGAGMSVQLTNRSQVAQRRDWRATVPETFTMANGSFKLKEPEPFEPTFSTDASGHVELAPGESLSFDVRAANLDPLALYRARLELSDDGRTRSQERYFGGCVGVPRVHSPVEFDGRMGDPAWDTAAVVHLDQPGQVARITPRTAKWDSPADLSGTMHFMWDDDYLYLGMKVTDSVYCNPEVDALMYRGDGLQFLVDPCRESDNKPGKYDYLCALTQKGMQAWCHASADPAKAPSNLVEDFKLKITPTGTNGDMVYELGIPWNRVSPFEPVPGGNLGLAMIINNDDGQIRDSFIAWFGCAHSKQMDMNGDLILLD